MSNPPAPISFDPDDGLSDAQIEAFTTRGTLVLEVTPVPSDLPFANVSPLRIYRLDDQYAVYLPEVGWEDEIYDSFSAATWHFVEAPIDESYAAITVQEVTPAELVKVLWVDTDKPFQVKINGESYSFDPAGPKDAAGQGQLKRME